MYDEAKIWLQSEYNYKNIFTKMIQMSLNIHDIKNYALLFA